MALQSTTAIATITLQQASSEVVFSGIPATYRDLILSCEPIGTISEQYFLRFNSDTGSNYSWVQMGADGGVFSSSTTTTGIRVGYFAASSARDNLQISIQDYAQTDKHKTALIRTNSNATAVRAIAGRWADTTAISTVRLVFPASTFGIGSTFSLFGRIA